MGLVDLPKLLSIDEAAGFLRISVLEARRAARDGDLPAVRVDGQLLIDSCCLLEELGVVMPSAGGPVLTVIGTDGDGTP